MNIKIKIFGIVASVLMVMLAVFPAVTATPPLSPPLEQALRSYPIDNKANIAIVEDFMSRWDGISDIPPEVQAAADILQTNMEIILNPYFDQQQPQQKYPQPPYRGLNAKWRTTVADSYRQIYNDMHLYWGWLKGYNQSNTNTLIWAAEFYGVTLPMIIIILRGLIVPKIIWWFMYFALFAVIHDVVTWLISLDGIQQYGVWTCFFKLDPWYWPTPLNNHFDYDQQPNHPWTPYTLFGKIGHWEPY